MLQCNYVLVKDDSIYTYNITGVENGAVQSVQHAHQPLVLHQDVRARRLPLPPQNQRRQRAVQVLRPSQLRPLLRPTGIPRHV